MQHIVYRLYETPPAPFEEMAAGLLDAYRSERTPVRIVLYGSPADNGQYLAQRAIARSEIFRRFGERAPVFSYVAQPPCGAGLSMEVHEVLPERGEQVHYKKAEGFPYIVLESRDTKRLFVAGLQEGFPELDFEGQAVSVFDRLETLMRAERMPAGSIVRQWNYIEGITRLDDSGRQRYQVFNDARSRFYETGTWQGGYPAATGIGTRAGGVLLGLDAVCSGAPCVHTHKIDNPLQVPAHDYSQRVLVGRQDEALKRKTTPKFERARTLCFDTDGMVYVSGTAAIRGESSLEGAGAAEQAAMTCENIEYLVSAANLQRFGVPATGDAVLTYLRVYLKHPRDRAEVERVIRARYPSLPVVYIEADVCREELLVEMEGAARFYR